MFRWIRNVVPLTCKSQAVLPVAWQSRVLSQVQLCVRRSSHLRCPARSASVLMVNFQGFGQPCKRHRSHATWVTSEDMDYKGRICIYSILGCPHCMKSKNTLQNLNLPYIDISLDIFPQCRAPLKERTGRKTVPQVFFNNHHIGGNDDFQKLAKDEHRLKKMIEEVKNNAPPPEAPVPPDPSTAVKGKGPIDFVCEPDEYVELVKDLRNSGLIKDHRQGLRLFKNSFRGHDFVDWVVKHKQLDRADAVMMGQELIDRHFGYNLKTDLSFHDDSVYYRLLDDIETNALNAGPMSDCEPQEAVELGDELRKITTKIYKAFVSKHGKKINYQAIGRSTEFGRYVRLIKEVQRVQVEHCTREEKLAFFINIYNTLVIHSNILKGPPVNLWQRYKFFNTVKYIIGGFPYSLNDIENGVLRSNRKGIGMITKPFSASDHRLKLSLERPEPMIHFALVCGSKSCPPLNTYSAEDVNEQLQLATEAFFDEYDGIDIDVAKKTIHLSQILKWYQEDFGTDQQGVLQWIYNHMGEDSDKKEDLGKLLETRDYKIIYQPYDWGCET